MCIMNLITVSLIPKTGQIKNVATTFYQITSTTVINIAIKMIADDGYKTGALHVPIPDDCEDADANLNGDNSDNLYTLSEP